MTPRDDASGEDTQVESEPLDENDSRTVAQQNVGSQVVAGGGEWPDPDAPARGPAPGTTAVGDAIVERRKADAAEAFTPSDDD